MTSIPLSDEDLFAAFEFVFPVHEMAKLRWKAVHDRADPTHTGLNAFWHQQGLATAEDRWVTTPNNDTLYSVAWVDLAQGPVRVEIPASGDRYVNLAFLDMHSNNFECLSQRDVGSGQADLILVGPHWTGGLPHDEAIVQAPCNDVMLFARTLVADQSDLPAARRVQQGFQVKPLGAVQPEAAPRRSDDAGEDFVLLVRDALRRNPPRSHEQGWLPLLAQAGLIDDGTAADDGHRWSALLPGFMARLKAFTRATNVPVDGWVYAPRNMGDFGTCYRLRAAVALGGLLALPRREAFYIGTELDAQQRELHGDHVYCVELPEGGVPADAFWSLTLYEKMPNGARFLARNVLDRYAFTDRTKTLQSSDGKVLVWISHRRPPAPLESNWLPAPAAPFRLALRAYHPRPALLAGEFRLKPVVRIEHYDDAPGSHHASA